MSFLRRPEGKYDPQSAKDRVAELAARQAGRTARRQAVWLGATGTQVRNWVRSGWLIRRKPGVYAVGHAGSWVKTDLIEAVLYAGPNAMLTGASGAWWLGLCDRRPIEIEVATPRRCASLPGIAVRGRRELTRIWHRELPVAPVADVLFDYATTARSAELRRALARVEYHDYLELDLLVTLLRQGKPGSRALRDALGDHDPRLARVRSPLEVDFLELCDTYGIPPPEVNVKLEGIEVDMLWRAERLIVELDGGGNHRTAAQMHRDRETDLRLRAARYLVQRYSRPQVLYRAARVAEDVRAALSSAGPWAARGSR